MAKIISQDINFIKINQGFLADNRKLQHHKKSPHEEGFT